MFRHVLPGRRVSGPGMVLAVGLALLASTAGAQSAEAADCYRTASVSGGNAYAYNDNAQYARHAATSKLCIVYSRSGGYALRAAGSSCGYTTARLRDLTLTFRNGSITACTLDGPRALYTSSVGSWMWDRPFPVNNECTAQVRVATRWEVNAANGTVTHRQTTPTHGDLTPRLNC